MAPGKDLGDGGNLLDGEVQRVSAEEQPPSLRTDAMPDAFKRRFFPETAPPRTPTSTDRYKGVLDMRTVAAILGVSRQRVHQFVAEGRLDPCGRIGRSLVFSHREVARFKELPRKTGRPPEAD